MPRRALWFLLGLIGVLSCGDSKSPTAATRPSSSTPTRIIALSGTLAFGNVVIGQEATEVFEIRNDGNATLTVTGLTTVGISAGSGVSRDGWTSASIRPGGFAHLTVLFAPSEVRSYDGTLRVDADHTSGVNTIAFTGSGVAAARPLPFRQRALFKIPPQGPHLMVRASKSLAVLAALGALR